MKLSRRLIRRELLESIVYMPLSNAEGKLGEKYPRGLCWRLFADVGQVGDFPFNVGHLVRKVWV